MSTEVTILFLPLPSGVSSEGRHVTAPSEVKVDHLGSYCLFELSKIDKSWGSGGLSLRCALDTSHDSSGEKTLQRFHNKKKKNRMSRPHSHSPFTLSTPISIVNMVIFHRPIVQFYVVTYLIKYCPQTVHPSKPTIGRLGTLAQLASAQVSYLNYDPV